MKTPIALLIFFVFGIVCSVVVSMLNTAFEPRNCGEDCVVALAEAYMFWIFLTAVSFSIVGPLAWFRSARTARSLTVITFFLMILFIAPAALVYGYRSYFNHDDRNFQKNISGSLSESSMFR
jgi:hypothetical protein